MGHPGGHPGRLLATLLGPVLPHLLQFSTARKGPHTRNTSTRPCQKWVRNRTRYTGRRGLTVRRPRASVCSDPCSLLILLAELAFPPPNPQENKFLRVPSGGAENYKTLPGPGPGSGSGRIPRVCLVSQSDKRGEKRTLRTETEITKMETPTGTSPSAGLPLRARRPPPTTDPGRASPSTSRTGLCRPQAPLRRAFLTEA